MNRNLRSIITSADGYKFGHHLMYPPGTEYVHGYIESRGCSFSNELMHFGPQYFLLEYLKDPITHEDVDFAKKFIPEYGAPFNEEGWRYIVEIHKGILPLCIRALPEGSVVPTHSVMMTIENTDPKCFWLPSFMETALLRSVWYGSGPATISFLCKKPIKKYADLTVDNPEAYIPFALNDFGARGVSSLESAIIGDMGHIVNFSGSDTTSGVIGAMEYYKADVSGFTIPAAEHGVITAFGKEYEHEAFMQMINVFAKKDGIFAAVSDSYDLMNAVEHIWIDQLLPIVKERGARVVIRPDSGDPIQITLEVAQLLLDKVGYTINKKGYKVLPSHVRIIQGDGVNKDSIEAILRNFERHNISAENIVFGMGGALLQQVNRDTWKFAQKVSAVKVNGIWRDVCKDPVTDPGKRSRAGRQTLVRNKITGSYRNALISEQLPPVLEDVLVTIFNNGIVESNLSTFDQVRKRANDAIEPQHQIVEPYIPPYQPPMVEEIG